MNANIIRKKIALHSKLYADKYSIPIRTITPTGVIIFKTYGDNLHGNFLQASYKNILINNSWKSRLDKSHTSFSKNKNIKELDSANSSDALLMNIFCHPHITKYKGVRKLFNLTLLPLPEFGWQARLKKTGTQDNTEIDMKMGDILIEAKLTEPDFQEISITEMLKYDDFMIVFDTNHLIQNNRKYLNYQIIRNILAAYQWNFRYYLICDIRRPDLIRNYLNTLICVKNISIRKRCNLVTWQEIAIFCGKEIRNFLYEKYGINNNLSNSA